MFNSDISRLPPLIQPVVERLVERLCESFNASPLASGLLNAESESLRKELVQVLVGSDFCAEQFIGDPDFFFELVDSGDLWRAYSDTEYVAQLTKCVPFDLPEQDFDRGLRRLRRREIIRIIWRDLCGFSVLEDVTGDMSLLADAMIQHSLDYYYQRFCDKLGVPFSSAGEQQHLVVVGMGKLGAFELNLSSDVDLIFCFPESGMTRGGKRETDNQTFFVRLGQRLIKSLSDVTSDGFVFRVDMRLRPYGQSGALVSSFDAMESYYENQGREWERYALIKARVVAGDKECGETLMNSLRPFVFRRYVDFGVIESLREMKGLINREVRRKGFEENVKTGSGGIREVEFIAQVFQLMRGGQEPVLQDRRLKVILGHLDKLGLLPPHVAKELMDAYVFLRDTEHRLQALEDRQTQILPMDEVSQARLAYSMDFDGWAFFDVELQQHRRIVRLHFEATISPAESTPDSEPDQLSSDLGNADPQINAGLWKEIWLDIAGVGQAQGVGFGDSESDSESEGEQVTVFAHVLPQLSSLQGTSFEGVELELLRLLRGLCQLRAIRHMQEVSRQRLDKLMPLLLSQLVSGEEGLRTLKRVLPLVEAIARRSAYIALLLENPGAAKRLIELCSASPWVAEQLAAHPILLDELLDPRSLYQPLELGQLADDLRQCILRIPSDDLEQQMEALRHFKRAQVLKVAAAEIVGYLPLMKVSDYLTWTAEALLECVLQLAWQQMVEKYGCPMKDKETPCDPDFIIVAYGKLGGIELGYGSDLDIVFLHDASTVLSTEGERSIDNVVFFARLGQRIIHLLTTNTPAGKLYEVDMRLRPSGSSGLLVSSLAAFEQYQVKEAWTWEHQALVRARVVSGCVQLTSRFEKVRQQILCQPREAELIRHDVLEMRQKMREHLLNQDGSVIFDLKQSEGGVVDIEFIVQYEVLRWAHDHQNLIIYTDNVRILEGLSRFELLPKADAVQLTQAYIAYRAATHRLVLQNQSAQLGQKQLEQKEVELQQLEQTSFCQHRENVRAIWDRLFCCE